MDSCKFGEKKKSQKFLFGISNFKPVISTEGLQEEKLILGEVIKNVWTSKEKNYKIINEILVPLTYF